MIQRLRDAWRRAPWKRPAQTHSIERAAPPETPSVAQTRFAPLTPDHFPAEYLELSPAVASCPPAPAFVLGGISPSLARFYHGEHHIPSVGLYHLDDVEVSSHSLVSRDGHFLVSPQTNVSPDAVSQCALYGELTATRIPSRVVEAPLVLLAGPGHQIWGHWLIDFLPRLHILHKAGFRIEDMQYLLPSTVPPFVEALLALLGIEPRRLVRFHPYQETVLARQLLLPTMYRYSSRVHPDMAQALRFLVERIAARNDIPTPPAGFERLFLSRRAAGSDGRLLLNRDAIEQQAAEAGFKVICPEQHPLLDQIALFQQARQIVGEYGSALHGSIFSAEGITVCGLRATTIHPGFLQSGLCEVKLQRIGYVLAATGEADIEQRFQVVEEDFALALRLMDLIG
ncbi:MULTISPECIES: DUF563 domain-containing protein [unclassified Variovorax]|uniref:glycosyltransferase family 61 protein n=1 Tax=unclassified Variovorax TaxID=663243 RepID=UPI001BD69589|nr:MULTISPECIES: glycosyltransferase 61 family protein [unclassified Variovorax]